MKFLNWSKEYSVLFMLSSLLLRTLFLIGQIEILFLHLSLLRVSLSIPESLYSIYLQSISVNSTLICHLNALLRLPTSSSIDLCRLWFAELLNYASIDEENDELSNIWKLRNVNYHDKFNWSLTLGLSKVIFISLSLTANLSILLKS